MNLPELRGVLTALDGAEVLVTIDGLDLARPADGARVMAMTIGCRTGDHRSSWLNTTFVVADGTLDRVTIEGVVPLRRYLGKPMIEEETWLVSAPRRTRRPQVRRR